MQDGKPPKTPDKIRDLLSRPRQSKKADFIFHVPEDVHRQFRLACKRRKIPMSQVITAFMINFAAGRYDDDDSTDG